MYVLQTASGPAGGKDKGWEARRALHNWSPSQLEGADDDDHWMYGEDDAAVGTPPALEGGGEGGAAADGDGGDADGDVTSRKRARVEVEAEDEAGAGDGEATGSLQELGVIEHQVAALPNFGPVVDLMLGLGARSSMEVEEV